MFNSIIGSLVVGSDNVGYCDSLALIFTAWESADCSKEAGLDTVKKLVCRLMLAHHQDILSKVRHKGDHVEKTALPAEQLQLG